jgi:hypothetical protein
METAKPDARGRIPLALKVLYTLFVLVLVPFYWRTYGPANFLYFCDVALLITLPAIWMESSLLVSTQALAILIPQAYWVFELLCRLIIGKAPTGMTGYMFDPNIPLFLRGLSLFHGWLPLLLLYLVWKLGYDRRALWIQCILGVAILLASYFLLPAPPPPKDDPAYAVNINFVYGLTDDAPQTYMHPLLWLAAMCVAFPLVVYWPTHLVLKRFFTKASVA